MDGAHSPLSKALVLTVGVGRDVVRSLRLAIEHHNPGFLLFLCTPQSLSLVHALVAELRLPQGTFHIAQFTETADVENLVLCYEQVIRRELFSTRGFTPDRIYVDYTRGTKAMSAALDYVAIELELAGISYITGDTDERGQVITGTERLLTFRPLELLFRRSWAALVQLFNARHFAGVLARVAALWPRTVREQHRRLLDLLSVLSQACQAWDALDYRSASLHFESALRDFADLLERLRVRAATQRASDIVHRIWGSRCVAPGCGCGLPLALETGPDLLAHADRRAEERRYDVASALLYRLMEYIAQRRLHDRGLRTDNVRTDLLPDALKGKWRTRAGSDRQLKVGMVHAFELLADLGDTLGGRFLELYWSPEGGLRGYLEARNMSPLAHAFQPVGAEVYEKLRTFVTGEFLAQLVPNWEERAVRCQMPRLPEEA